MNNPSPPIQIHTPRDLGRAVRHQRKRDGLTLVEAAGLVNVGVRFLSELENGKPTVRLDKILQVVNGLGLRMGITFPGGD